MQLKRVLSNKAYWTINKSLANDIGLDATILLQHFIDLQSSFFKDGGFYQQQDRLVEDLPLTIDYLRKATKVLVDRGFITVKKKGIPAKNHYTVNEGYLIGYLSRITSDTSEGRLEVSEKDDKEYLPDTTNTNNKNTKNKDTNSEFDKVYNKLIEGYPKNRIQSKNPVIKLLKDLDKDQIALVLKNKERYLKASNGYVKNLRKYIEEECWSEEWLNLEESTNKTRNTGITTENHNFNTNTDYE